MYSLVVSSLLIIVICISQTVAVSTAFAAETAKSFNFNSCRDLSKESRDQCLLELSSKLALVETPKKNEKTQISTSLKIRHGMLTDRSNLEDGVGQFFITSLTPELNLNFQDTYFVQLSIPTTSISNTGVDNLPDYTFGRPELLGLVSPLNSTTTWKTGLGVRFPLYYRTRQPRTNPYTRNWATEPYSRSDGSSEPYRIWQVSWQNFVIQPLPSKFAIELDFGIFYNSDYNYKAYYDEMDYDRGSVDHLVQFPITTKSRIGLSKSFTTQKLDLNFLAQYGFTGREILFNADNSKNDIPGIQMTAIELAWQTTFANSWTVGAAMAKALKYQLDQGAWEANIDDPTYVANLAASGFIKKSF